MASPPGGPSKTTLSRHGASPAAIDRGEEAGQLFESGRGAEEPAEHPTVVARPTGPVLGDGVGHGQ